MVHGPKAFQLRVYEVGERAKVPKMMLRYGFDGEEPELPPEPPLEVEKEYLLAIKTIDSLCAYIKELEKDASC